SSILVDRFPTLVYIAPHNLPQQLIEESDLRIALLHASVKYVVRVSTNVEYIGPTNPVFYGRAHWAIENLLSQPEFKDLQWTLLQPNFFTASYLASAAEWVKAYRTTGKVCVVRGLNSLGYACGPRAVAEATRC
ncbi:hypothetical protein B0J13DRAFT_458349, partial [Dactylonectria estremocensis]